MPVHFDRARFVMAASSSVSPASQVVMKPHQ